MRHPRHMSRRRWINLALIVAIVLALIGIGAALRGPGEQPTANRTLTVDRATVSATASATGEVVAANAVTLTFASPGIVRSVNVESGERVEPGTVLATVDDTAARQQVSAAESTLAQAQTNAANAVAQLDLAESSVDASDASLESAVEQARVNLDVARRSWSEACLNPDDPSCPNPSAAESVRQAQNAVTVAQLAYDIAVTNASKNEITYNLSVNQAGDSLAAAKSNATSQCATYGNDSPSCKAAQDGILPAQQFYDTQVNGRTMNMMRDLQGVQQASMTLSNANVALRKLHADLRKAHQDGVRQAQQALDNAKIARDRGRVANAQSLQSAKSGLMPTDAGVSVTQAAVRAAEAGLASARRALRDTTLVAPIAGEVGALTLTVGEPAATAANGVTIVPTDSFEVEAPFAESDAAGIEVGQPAEVTFEGLPGITASGSVVSVDPVAQTSATNNLVTYAVRVTLQEIPTGLRQGMTATVSVTTQVVENVIAVPQAAITTVGGESTVEVMNADDTTTRVVVTTGVQGDVLTEITNGLSGGEQLVIPSASTSGFPDGGVPGGGFGGGRRAQD